MKLKERKKKYRTKLKVEFDIDKNIISLLPTILYHPWKYRYVGSYAIIIYWLCFAVGIGIWEE